MSVNIRISKKKKFITELKRNTNLWLCLKICAVIIMSFIICPLVSFFSDLCIQKAGFHFLDDAEKNYFGYWFWGLMLCTALILSLIIICVFIDICFCMITWFKAVNNSTYLPLTTDEINNLGIKTAREYIIYIYKKLVYYGLTNNTCYIYMSEELYNELHEAGINYFINSKKECKFFNKILNALYTAATYKRDFNNKELTSKMIDNIIASEE